MKPILLQTTPHTGTHTGEYLFNYLGGIPTYYMHFGDWQLPEFLEAFGEYRERFVILQLFRPYQDIVATYKKRVPAYALDPDHANSAENLVRRNLIVENRWKDEFSEAFVLPIGFTVELQTEVARIVFKACGAEVPASASEFMKVWSPKGTWNVDHPPGDLRGFDNEADMEAMTEIMNEYRIMRSNDWRDKVNLSLKELSN